MVKLNFALLTHSFNELDATLKQIVDDAIDDAWTDGVACSQEQWTSIKALLDDSLYLSYGDWSMIKNAVGINGRGYRFGCTSNAIGGPYLNIKWENNLLFAQQGEL